MNRTPKQVYNETHGETGSDRRRDAFLEDGVGDDRADDIGPILRQTQRPWCKDDNGLVY
jgi:hypothetical protein